MLVSEFRNSLSPGDPQADAGQERQLQERHQDHHHQEVRRWGCGVSTPLRTHPPTLEPCFFWHRYRNQYPILGLLGDDYQVSSPVREAQTIVIERTGESVKQVKKSDSLLPPGGETARCSPKQPRGSGFCFFFPT